MKKAGANAGQTLSFREKIELAKLLDRLALSVIETPPIVAGKPDELFIKSLAGTVRDSTLAVPLDLDNPDTVSQTWEALRKAAHPRLQVSVPVSTVQMEYLCHRKPDAVLALISDLVSRCAALCPEVEFIAEDSGRAQEEFLHKAFDAAVGAGAGIVTICDTAGNMLADEFAATVKAVRAYLPREVPEDLLHQNQDRLPQNFLHSTNLLYTLQLFQSGMNHHRWQLLNPQQEHQESLSSYPEKKSFPVRHPEY